MAIRERLLKQLNIVRDGLNAMPPFLSRGLRAIHDALVQARDLCFQGLSEKHFAEYKDTYDGLLLAVDQLAADAPDQGEIVSLCSELLQYTITQTQKETAFKKEIFFLPYKASMWDSLESVWKAADEDKEHCIAYVMPIPYADLTPEHTVAEWHCERGLFPKDVPTVDWEDFDLQEIHPDVIFIHNPYDEYNRVTSVESRFYSSKLKDQTDKLVYIPYFVLAEPELDSKSEEEIKKIEEGIEGFVLTPAVLNAHQVIVQSEAMRQVYINVLLRGTDQKNRAYWEKRIFGTGSPKIDKVLTTKKEDIDIPDEWLKIIKKPDGSWKKIIFYNIGLSAFLEYNEKMLAKIRQVLKTFKEQKDQVALLWRPHPLMRATIQSMRPKLADEYERILTEYNEGTWGIYDDSADIDRAIILSDAYYGDRSSVVQLYAKTGKAIMIQNVEVERLSALPALWFVSGIQRDDGFYFPAWDKNGFFRIPKGSNEPERVAFFPDNFRDNYLYCKVFEYEKKFWFVPTNGHGILSYEMETGEWQSFPFASEKVKNDTKPWFTDAYLKGELLWLKPYHAHVIVSFNLRTHKTGYYTTWFEEISPYIKDDGLLFGSGTMVGDEMIFPFLQGNKVVSFDTGTGQSQVYHIGSEEDICQGLSFDGVSFWLYTKEGDLLRWKRAKNEILRYRDVFGKKIHSAALCCGKGALWIFAVGTDDYVRMDIATEQMEIHRSYLGGAYNMPAPCPVICGDYIYIYPNNTEVTVKLSMATGEIETLFLKQSERDYREFCARCVKEYKEGNHGVDNSSVWSEIPTCMLDDLFNVVGNGKRNALDVAGAIRIGKEIYGHTVNG